MGLARDVVAATDPDRDERVEAEPLQLALDDIAVTA